MNVLDISLKNSKQMSGKFCNLCYFLINEIESGAQQILAENVIIFIFN